MYRKIYLLLMLFAAILFIAGCNGGSGSISGTSSTGTGADKAEVSFKVDFGDTKGVGAASLLGDIASIRIEVGAGCEYLSGEYGMDEDYWQWYEGQQMVRFCGQYDNITLTRDNSSKTIYLPTGYAKFTAYFIAADNTTIDGVSTYGKLVGGKNTVYLPTLRGTWQLDKPIDLQLVNNAQGYINDNLTTILNKITALHFPGYYEVILNDGTKEICDFYPMEYDYDVGAVSLKKSAMQFDSNTPMRNVPYGADYYDSANRRWLSCGTPLISFEYDNSTKRLFNYNLWWDEYNTNDGTLYIDSWQNKVNQFKGSQNANMLAFGIGHTFEKVNDNGSYHIEEMGIETMGADPLLTTPDYKAYTYYDYTDGKIKGNFIEHISNNDYQCYLRVYDWVYDNTTQNGREYVYLDNQSVRCDYSPNSSVITAAKVKNVKSTKNLISAKLSKASFVVDNITDYSMDAEGYVNWFDLCYNDNGTWYAPQNYSCGSDRWVSGEVYYRGTQKGKYRVIPFTATKRTTFDPINFAPGATIINYIIKGISSSGGAAPASISK